MPLLIKSPFLEACSWDEWLAGLSLALDITYTVSNLLATLSQLMETTKRALYIRNHLRTPCVQHIANSSWVFWAAGLQRGYSYRKLVWGRRRRSLTSQLQSLQSKPSHFSKKRKVTGQLLGELLLHNSTWRSLILLDACGLSDAGDYLLGELGTFILLLHNNTWRYLPRLEACGVDDAGNYLLGELGTLILLLHHYLEIANSPWRLRSLTTLVITCLENLAHSACCCLIIPEDILLSLTPAGIKDANCYEPNTIDSKNTLFDAVIVCTLMHISFNLKLPNGRHLYTFEPSTTSFLLQRRILRCQEFVACYGRDC